MEEKYAAYIGKLAAQLNSHEDNPLFAALHCFLDTSDMIDKYIVQDLRDQPITFAAFNVLHLLILNKGTLMPTEISNKTWRSKHAVTKIIDTLEKLELVKRLEIEGCDRRVRKVTITKKGLDLVNNFSVHSSARISHQVLRSLDEQELQVFTSILKRLKKDVHEQIQDTAAKNP